MRTIGVLVGLAGMAASVLLVVPQAQAAPIPGECDILTHESMKEGYPLRLIPGAAMAQVEAERFWEGPYFFRLRDGNGGLVFCEIEVPADQIYTVGTSTAGARRNSDGDLRVCLDADYPITRDAYGKKLWGGWTELRCVEE